MVPYAFRVEAYVGPMPDYGNVCYSQDIHGKVVAILANLRWNLEYS